MPTDLAVETQTDTTADVVLPRHLVEKDGKGGYADQALCGFLWDRMNVSPNGAVCEECAEEFKRREEP